MKHSEAVALLESAVPRGRGTWGDLGCGDGVFTASLLELLGPGSRIYGVDRDRRALAAMQERVKHAPEVIPIVGDFTRPLDIPTALDGILLANALHYARDGEAVLARLVLLLRRGGRVVFVEYDHRAANPWVPYPIDFSKLEALAASAGLSEPVVTARRPSRFSGDLYVAAADRSA